MALVAYLSTRGQVKAQRFSEVALDGLAADGGLMLPEQIVPVSAQELAAWRQLDYVELAVAVMSRFVDDIAPAELKRLVALTYTEQVFGSKDITPLSWLDERIAILHLSNGPTLAFKDIAMQWLGVLFEHLLTARGESLNILGATSGDTGSAALLAMRGKERLRVFMLSPDQRMSPFQAAQMYSVSEANCFNLALRGNFDEAQDIVKALSQDAAFKKRVKLGSVNSINWARLVAQVVYYFKGYFAATADNSERISFSVPSGNFGNIYAGHVARRMGLPIERLVCATNENDVLDEFFRTGVYRARGAHLVHVTSSPSMDISRASNFERLVFDLYQGDAERVRRDWQRLAEQGFFRVSDQELARVRDEFGFVSGASSHQERLDTIRWAYQTLGVLVDPHTADGLGVARRRALPGKVVVLETAQPAKFEKTMQEALGYVPARPAAFAGLENRPQRVKVIDASQEAVRHEIETAVIAS